MVENKYSIKFSETNKEFWRRLNINLVKIDKIKNLNDGLSYNDTQEKIVNFFKNNVDIYNKMLNSINLEKKTK